MPWDSREECLELIFHGNAEHLLGAKAVIIQLHRIEVISRKEMEMIDITPEVDRLVEASGAKQGIVFVITAHTTSGIVVTEGVECLERDIPAHLERLAPKEPPVGRVWLLSQPPAGLRRTTGIQRRQII